MLSANLRNILNPESIAVIGASEDLAKVGGRVIHSLIARGFLGSVFPINPKREVIQKLKCYESISAVQKSVELCVIAVSAVDVEDQVRQCLAAGVKGLIVLSSGFAEQDAEGILRQDRLTELVRASSVPMIGPNCLGVMNAFSGLVASSTFSINDRKLISGGLGFLTQSGAIGTYWLDMILSSGLGISSWVSTGNEATVDIAELLDYLVDDDQTKVIGMYVEGVRNGVLFRQAALKAKTKKKPILILKAGRSTIGAAAAASHTGALAGEDSLYDAFFEQFGISRVNSLSEMLDMSRVLSTQPAQSGKRTCVLSVSGGAGVLITDVAIANGLVMPELSEVLKSKLQPLLPDFAAAQNPLDITAQIATEPELLGKVLKVITESREFDQIVVFCGALGNLQQQLAEGIIRGVIGWKKPCVVIWQASRPLAVDLLTGAGIPVFSEIPTAVLALARVTRMAGFWETEATPPECMRLLTQKNNVDERILTEHESKDFLFKKMGLQRPDGLLIRLPLEEFSGLENLKSPFAVKLQSPQLIHKSGSGGIRLGLNRELVKTSVLEMFELAQSQKIDCQGVLVESMEAIQFEFLLGLRRDPVLGPFLIIGRGGVSVEVDPDVTRSFLPLTVDDILSMFARLRTRALYEGFRGKKAAPLQKIAEVVHKLTQMYLDDPSIKEVEINPLVCNADDAVVALDASVWLTSPQIEFK